MARVAVIVSNPCVNDARVIKMAQAAAETGHEVHVFATFGQNAAPYEHVDGVTYHRLEWRPGSLLTASGPLAWIRKLSAPVATWFVRRILPYRKYRLFTRVFAESVAAVKPDLVHAHDLVCLPAGYEAAQLAGARLVYDAHELEVHRNPPLPLLQKLLVGRVEKRYARKADAVITVGQLVARELGRHIGRDDITVIYNSPVVSPCPNSIRRDLRIGEDTPLILYVGKVTEGRGVRQLLDLLPQVPGAILAAVGPCDARSKTQLVGHARRRGLTSRFHILPAVPSDQVVSYIRGADVGVISVEPVTLSYRYCMPNKLFEMSFAEIAILSNKLDEIEGFLAEIGNGEIVDFEERARIAYTLSRMLKDKERYALGEQARRILDETYSWKAQGERLRGLYERVLAGGPAAVRVPAEAPRRLREEFVP